MPLSECLSECRRSVNRNGPHRWASPLARRPLKAAARLLQGLGSPHAALPTRQKTICISWPLVRFPPTDSVLLSIMLPGTIVPCGEPCVSRLSGTTLLAHCQSNPLHYRTSFACLARTNLSDCVSTVMSRLRRPEGTLGVRAWPCSFAPPKRKNRTTIGEGTGVYRCCYRKTTMQETLSELERSSIQCVTKASDTPATPSFFDCHSLTNVMICTQEGKKVRSIRRHKHQEKGWSTKKMDGVPRARTP